MSWWIAVEKDCFQGLQDEKDFQNLKKIKEDNKLISSWMVKSSKTQKLIEIIWKIDVCSKKFTKLQAPQRINVMRSISTCVQINELINAEFFEDYSDETFTDSRVLNFN